MPRLTNTDYLLQRARLRDNWINHGASVFKELETIEEMELHAYFAPMRDLIDEEAVLIRQQATSERPYLPARAGKVYAKALPYLDNPPPSEPTLISGIRKRAHRQPGSVVTIKTIARPEVDVHKLAMALLAMAREEIDRDIG